jgi:hypothetical protein
VLAILSQGQTIRQAVAEAGRSEAAFRQWSFTEPEFKVRADAARIRGKQVQDELIDIKKISYEDFCNQFLDIQIYPHQRNWVELLEGNEPSWLHPAMTYEPGASNRLLFNVPPEHAKSTTMTVNYVCYQLAINPNIRIVIVSKTLGMARKFLLAIKDRLSHPAWTKMQVAFGPQGGYKADSVSWTSDMIYLGAGRNAGEKDPTVQALGIRSQIYGARADLVILDDVVTLSNAHEWEKQLEWLQNDVITRLGRRGKLLVIGTRVDSLDLYKKIRDPEQWSGHASPFTYFACPAVLEFDEDPAKWKTLWPITDRPEVEDEEPELDGSYRKWDGPALFTRRSEVSPSIWARVYQQEDIAENAIFSPACVQGSTNGMRKRGILKIGAPGHPRAMDGSYTVMGLDPAFTGATGAVVATYNRADGKIYILDAVNMTDSTPAKIRALMEEWVLKYKVQELRIEINAHQKGYALDDDLRSWMVGHGCQLNSHFTGKNKWDVDIGVAGMAPLFGTTHDNRFQDNNIICLPSNENSEGIKTLVQELITWKPSTKNPTDVVMAMWFCVIRLREMMQRNSHLSKFSNNRWATRSQLQNRVTINLDEAFAEQWAGGVG